MLKALRQLAKQAAEEGWGDGPENWAQGDFATLSSSEIEATNQLSELLQSARRNALPPPDQRWKLALFAGALVLGLLIAYQFRGPFILADSEPKVLKFETPLEQLFHAKTMADSPEGWRAVWDDRFGEIDLYTRHLAMQGLVRYYFRVGDHSSALPALRELAALPESQRSLRTFGLVGLAVAHAELQHKQQAQEAIQLLSTTDLGDLSPHRRGALRTLPPTSSVNLGPSKGVTLRRRWVNLAFQGCVLHGTFSPLEPPHPTTI